MATPRNLDPKFKNEKADALEQPENREEQQETKQDDDTPMIVHRQRVVEPDGTVGEKVHGPMPVANWPAYEKEHNL